MMAEIHRIGGSTPAKMVNDDLVRMLEDLIESAKSGEIVGLAYCTTDGDDMLKTGWDSGGHNLLLCASVAMLQSQYNLGLVGE